MFQEDIGKGDEMSYYVHDVPGRLRVKTPAIKGNPARALQIEELLSKKEGVLSVVSNKTTGSVVINYDSDVLNKEAILDILTKRGHFDPSKVVTNDQLIEDTVSKSGKLVSKAVLGLLMDAAFGGTPLSVLTAIL